MRKVLMISYAWPPTEGVGLIRALKFAKYLPEFNWQPLVLTVKTTTKDVALEASSLNNMRVFRTYYRDVLTDIKNLFRAEGDKEIEEDNRDSPIQKLHKKGNRIQSVLRELISIPDEQIGWYKYAVRDGEKIIIDEGVDLIFSTSPPETAHLIARRMKMHSRIPWVADLRDLWSKDHFRDRPLIKKSILHFMERHVLKEADLVMTVSRPWAEELTRSLKDKRVEVIENGFDDEDFEAIGYKKNEKFTICYTGKLHRIHQSVEVLFKVLRDLIDENRIDRDRIEARFYLLGYDRPDISSLAERYGLTGIVSQLESVEYIKSLEIQKSSDILLFVQWKGHGFKGWYSAKLYDYIGARRPILALAERGGIIEDIIKRTQAGLLAYDERALRQALILFYEEYVKNGYIKYNGVEEEIAKHTRRVRTAHLARSFDSLVNRKR